MVGSLFQPRQRDASEILPIYAFLFFSRVLLHFPNSAAQSKAECHSLHGILIGA